MPDMLVCGGSVLRILEDSFFRDDDETLGETVRMFAGNLGSTERTPKEAYRAQALFLTLAEETAFRVIVADPGNALTVTGVGLPATITANVRLGRSQPFEYLVGLTPTLYQIADLRLRET